MKTTAQIIDYLDGKLSGKELENFLLKIETDSELKELVYLHKEVDTVLADKAALNYYEKLEKGYMNYMQSEEILNPTTIQRNYSRFRLNPLYKYAAVGLLLIGIGMTFILVKRKQYSPSQLYSMYYQPYDTDITIRSSSVSNSKILEGITLYQKGQYEKANEIFVKIIAEDNESMEACFYQSLSLIELERYDEAIKSLQVILESDNSAYTSHADWYLSLCYLKLNKTDQAISILQVLRDSTSHYYSIKAKEMLRKMK